MLPLLPGVSFADLYDREGLARLDSVFLEHLREASPAIHGQLLAARENPSALTLKQGSELIIEVAPYLDDFLGHLFGIMPELQALRQRHHALAPLYYVKRQFVQRKALTGQTPEKAAALDGLAIASQLEELFLEPLTERSFATHVARWTETKDAEAAHATQLKLAAQYAAWAALTPAGRARHKDGILFKTPHKLDMFHLVPAQEVPSNGLSQLQFGPDHWRDREGFQLTDPGMDLLHVLDQTHYCIKCHNQGKDSRSHGLKEKDGAFKSSVFGVKLAGCPLEEKISEMNVVREHG
ncbi:MAG: pyridine nucleotide-disulfide oxidoreductase, partial [Acidobacteriota bacterium]